MPPKRGKKESKRTLYHILGNLDEFVPPTTCHTSLQELLLESASDEDPLSDSPPNSAVGSPFGRSVSPMSPSADPLVAPPRCGAKRGRAEMGEAASSPLSHRTIVIGGATAERKWGRKMMGEGSPQEGASDSPMFLTELGMRERVAQRNLESTLYFAETVGNSKEIGPLREFADWVDGIGVARHLQDIRHMGHLQQLHFLLVDKPFSTRITSMTKRGSCENVAKCQALLLLYLCHQTPLEVISTPELFTFLVDLVARLSCPNSSSSSSSPADAINNSNPASFPPPPQLPPPKKSHWSSLLSKGKKGTTIPSTSDPPTAPPTTTTDVAPEVDSTEQHVWTTIRSWLQKTVGMTATEGIPTHIQQATILSIVLDTMLFVVLGSNRRSSLAKAACGSNDPTTRLFEDEGGMMDGESQLDSQLSASHRLASMSTDSFSESHQGAITKPSSLLFVGAGGLGVACRLLDCLHAQEKQKVASAGKMMEKRYYVEEEAPELSKLIQLLETVSCCEDLRYLPSEEQLPLSHLLLKIISMLPLKEGSTTNNEIFMRRIRVCLNISSVSPQSVPWDDLHCGEIGGYLASVFQSASAAPEDDEDHSKLEVCSSSVCLMVNLLKRGVNNTFRWSLLHSLEGSFALKASAVAQRYYSQEGDVSMSVTAGYIAVMLGMLSLGDPDARVTVVTALLNGAQDAVRSVRHKPMLWVIAVLQEFILFQSTAQILTKNTVVTLTTVVNTLMEENGISVGDGSATPPE